MTKLEIQQAHEILRLRSLCRHAASELKALDNIVALRHPRSSGLSQGFIDMLEEQKFGDFVDKYDDLVVEKKEIAKLAKKVECDLLREEDFEDFVV